MLANAHQGWETPHTPARPRAQGHREREDPATQACRRSERRRELLLLTKLDENVWVGLDKLVKVRIRANVHTAVILGIASRRCQGKRSDRCSHSNPRMHRDKQRRERLNAKQQGADNEPNQSYEREWRARRGVCACVSLSPCVGGVGG
jgi:hypothetical protein